MRKLVFGLASAAALAVSSPALAAVTVTGGTTIDPIDVRVTDGVTTIGFAEAQLAANFVENLSFTNTLAGVYSVNLSTSSPAVDFTSAVLTGPGGNFNLTQVFNDGTSETRVLSPAVQLAAGTFNLAITGVNRGNGSLGGTITIRDVGAVPEPATWAMMLLGFGAIGVGFRRSRRQQTALLQAA
jgi:hypothetical protein